MRIVLACLAALAFLGACGKKAPLRTPSSDRPPAGEGDWTDDGRRDDPLRDIVGDDDDQPSDDGADEGGDE